MNNPDKTAVFRVEPLRLSLSAWARELETNKSTLSRWFERAGEPVPSDGVSLLLLLRVLAFDDDCEPAIKRLKIGRHELANMVKELEDLTRTSEVEQLPAA